MSKENGYAFEKLTPVSDSELGIYEDALDFVFQKDNDDVRNIAISGAYGAGKSSVLSSYKSKHPERKYIHISLAHFSDNDDDKESAPATESVLEGKILNQLIHQIPAERIPQTNFRVKKTVEKKQLVCTTVEVVLLILSTLCFVLNDKWKTLIDSMDVHWLKSFMSVTATPEARLIAGVFMVAIFCTYTYKAVRIQKSRNIFRKLSVQGNEIEIFEESEDSYFDKYLNEVLYLFENADADVIVFEDMDRFESNQIFERLREVNTLTNLQREKDGKGVLRFFYLLRDDIFVSKDRTKFFDYIIPVVPVIDSSNSYSQFISHLKRNDLIDKFDGRFLQGLSLYVDDMRLLKNICNEFVIYYDRINTTELDPNKMLALIVYKNLFPDDYACLQLNRGFIYALFEHKETFLGESSRAIEQRIKDKKTEIDAINNEHLQTVRELDDMLTGWQSRTRNDYSGNSRREISEWKENEYPKRKQLIEAKDEGRIGALEKEITQLEQQLITSRKLPLSRIITRDNIETIFHVVTKNGIGEIEEYIDIKRSEYFDLLKYLIRNGYIDETYADYMTYFYEDSLSKVDKIFLRSVTDKRAKDYTYELKNPKMVIERLQPEDFDQVETLNNCLLDYLLDTENKTLHLDHLIGQIKDSRNFAFVEQYFAVTSHTRNLVSVLNTIWPEMFSEMLNGNAMSKTHIRQYSIYTLYYSDDRTIQKMNIDGVLTDYIRESPDFLEIDAPNIERLLNGFQLLNVYFPAIDYQLSDKQLFSSVYDSGRYVINYRNIDLILTEVYGVQDKEDIRHKTTSLIFQDPTSPLAERVRENITIYFDVIISECKGVISDDEFVAVDILNNTAITNDSKKKYINALQTHITKIASIEDQELWSMLLSKGIIVFSAKNVLDYYMYIGKLDETVIDFINNAGGMDFSDLDDPNSDGAKKLFTDIVKCNSLSNKAYKRSITSTGLHWNTFAIEDILDEKVIILIDNSKILMNPDTLVFMRENYSECLPHYIAVNIDEYMRIIDESLFRQDELISVLDMKVGDKKKLALLAFSKEPITIVNKGYSLRIREYILRNNLYNEDMNHLYNTFSKCESEIKDIILEYAINNVREIALCLGTVDRELKNQLMNSADVSIDEKIELLIADIPYIDKTVALNYLHIVHMEVFEKIFDSNTRPRFEDCNINRRLLEAFIAKKWIYDFYVEDGFLKIHRREPRKRS